ncbi:MAG: GNAT family N-acetyltransferase [Clostridia bacterium]
MANIKRAEKSQTYEILDLWLRTAVHSNPFIENNFWEKYYDKIKNKYFTDSEGFVYIIDNKIVGFICVTDDNSIQGLFVDPDYQKQGIGTEMIEFAKTEYSLLHLTVYAKNRSMLNFSTHRGFVIDGAIRNPYNEQIQYTMIWSE